MDRRLAAILAADVAAYGRHVEKAEEATLSLLRELWAMIAALVAEHHGRTFGSAGDSLLAEFRSPVEAVRCAMEVQQAIERKNVETPEPHRMKMRIGVHLGDVVVDGENLQGEGVNIAVRLESIADPGRVLISEDVYSQVHRTLSFGYDNLGERKLKNIAEPMRVYRVQPAPMPWWQQQYANPRKRRRGYALIGALAILSAIVILAANRERLPQSWRNLAGLSAVSSNAQASIAILPLKSLNDSKEDYFSDGLTQDITGELGRFKNLFVIASNSAFTYKDKPAKAQDIGRDLGVNYLLEGTVQRGQDRVRLSAQLVDTKTGAQVWGERYDQEGTDIFGIQDNIVQAVVTQLAVEVDAAEFKKILEDETNNATAYDHYLRGRQEFYNYTKESVETAKAEFSEAIRLDPKFARAYGWLGYANLQDVQDGWTTDPDQSAKTALELGLKGVALAPDDYYTHWNLASIYAGRKDMERAYKEYDAALALNSNDADLLAEMADMFSYQGEPDKAIQQIERAKKLNPKYPAWYDWSLGFAFFQKRDYAKTIASLEKLSDPSSGAYLLLVASKAKLGSTTPVDEIITHLRAKDPEWAPDHLDRYPFVKPEDQQHWLDSLKAIGIAAPNQSP